MRLIFLGFLLGVSSTIFLASIAGSTTELDQSEKALAHDKCLELNSRLSTYKGGIYFCENGYSIKAN